MPYLLFKWLGILKPISTISCFTEYSALNDEIDSLNNCLDELENWNDALNSRMREFLENMQKSRLGNNETTKESLTEDKMDVDK